MKNVICINPIFLRLPWTMFVGSQRVHKYAWPYSFPMRKNIKGSPTPKLFQIISPSAYLDRAYIRLEDDNFMAAN